MARSKIEWCDRVWNPVTGCTKISAGCDNCYAERMSRRFAELWGLPRDNPFNVTLHLDRLDQPLRWKKASKVFICSMADLFHDDVLDSFLDEIFGIILASQFLSNNRRHIFMILTKRPERMHSYLTSRTPVELLKTWSEVSNGWTTIDDPDVLFNEELIYSECCGNNYKPWDYIEKLFPLPNLWLGVTAENQEQADKRIPILLQIPAALRFVSVEPMLGPIDLSRIQLGSNGYGYNFTLNTLTKWAKGYHDDTGKQRFLRNDQFAKLDWVICGGESGPGARPMHPDWARSLRNQCQAANIPYFFKQWGEWAPEPGNEPILPLMEKGKHGVWDEDGVWHFDEGPFGRYENILGTTMYRVGKKSAGSLLDGQEWKQFPRSASE